MSNRAKYRAKHERWFEAFSRRELPYQVAQRMNDDANRALDLQYLAALHEQGFVSVLIERPESHLSSTTKSRLRCAHSVRGLDEIRVTGRLVKISPRAASAAQKMRSMEPHNDAGRKPGEPEYGARERA